MNVEEYNNPMAAVLGMNKTDFHVMKLQSTVPKGIICLLQDQRKGGAGTNLYDPSRRRKLSDHR
jgi:hypothetical protein